MIRVRETKTEYVVSQSWGRARYNKNGTLLISYNGGVIFGAAANAIWLHEVRKLDEHTQSILSRAWLPGEDFLKKYLRDLKRLRLPQPFQKRICYISKYQWYFEVDLPECTLLIQHDNIVLTCLRSIMLGQVICDDAFGDLLQDFNAFQRSKVSVLKMPEDLERLVAHYIA